MSAIQFLRQIGDSETKRQPLFNWKSIVRHAPIVSVDLVVQADGGGLLGKRTNDPAKGAWFVPGGRVHKDERLADAVHRVAREELGIDIQIERQLGVYEHFYDTAALNDVDGKQYVPIGYLVTATDGTVTPDDQHSAFRQFSPPFDEIELHPYVRTYLEDAGLLST